MDLNSLDIVVGMVDVWGKKWPSRIRYSTVQVPLDWAYRKEG